MTDIEHRKIQNIIVANFTKPSKYPPYKVSVEFHYNYYGDRGYIDVLIENENAYIVKEIKTNLNDIGEAIRQLHRAESYLRRENKHKRIVLDLVIPYSKENVNKTLDVANMISATTIRVQFLGAPAEVEYFCPSQYKLFEEGFDHILSWWRGRFI